MHFDLVIIGAGPGGYVAAIRASQLGMNVALVEKRSTPGGTCLNVGCIPSKALLHSAFKYSQACHEFEKHGIEVDGVRVNISTMMEHKDKVVHELTSGVNYLLKKNNVTRFKGQASLIKEDEHTKISVEENTEKTILTATHILLATGSEVVDINGLPVDEERILSSTGALALSHIPKHMIVVGGGYIGLELGSVWKRLGTEVTVIEAGSDIALSMDTDVRRELRKSLEHLGMIFHTHTKVLGSTREGDKIHVDVEKTTGRETLICDHVLVSVGRKPCTEGLGLKECGIETDVRGFIKVDTHFNTTTKGVFAIGDVIGGMMLAHKAEEEAIACVENLAGQRGHVNYDVIPAVIFTQPEVASVGITEDQAKDQERERGLSYKVGKFPFSGNSLSKALSSTEGFVKIIADSKTDRILGVHIIGAHAGSMIAEAAIAMEFGASSEDLARTCHAHPTHSEALKEAAWDTFAQALHK